MALTADRVVWLPASVKFSENAYAYQIIYAEYYKITFMNSPQRSEPSGGSIISTVGFFLDIDSQQNLKYFLVQAFSCSQTDGQTGYDKYLASLGSATY